MSRRWLCHFALAAMAMGGVGCAALFSGQVVAVCPEGSQSFREYQLFFGRRGTQGNEVVSQRAWQKFLSEIVTPLFPAGLTVFDGRGQWQGKSRRIVRERSKVLLVLVAHDDKLLDESLSKIAVVTATYKKRFRQESVLTTTRNVCAAF